MADNILSSYYTATMGSLYSKIAGMFFPGTLSHIAGPYQVFLLLVLLLVSLFMIRLFAVTVGCLL